MFIREELKKYFQVLLNELSLLIDWVYQEIEAGRSLPSVTTLLNLSTEFHISMDSLFTDIQSELKNLSKNANEKE
jgi:hypothetical protein